ncbi:MAG TPA: hypothetical protein PLQ97_02180 [Myxococcota bacterium]|nr:hypothetical protein [Myxococcota bacterium]HQK50303.1 hypothetical protein [Myxococcota bacterium]
MTRPSIGIWRLLALGLVALLPMPAFAGDFMDTRITWTFGDDDVARKSGEKVPDSPLPGIGDRKGYELFMDNLDTKTKGRENLTHIVLYKKMPGFLTGLTTEAGLVLKLDLGSLMEGTNPRVTDVLRDDGTYLRAAWTWNAAAPDRNYIGLTFFPFDTERFRLGYLWDISWGGGNIFSSRKTGPAPGFKVDVRGDAGKNVALSGYVGLKTARVSQVVQLGSADAEEITVQETNYGVLAGLGIDLYEWVRLDLGFGWFQQGTFSRTKELIGDKVYTLGGSGRLTIRQGLPIQTSVDYMLYRSDPDVNVVDWWREKYQKGKFSWSVSGEFNYLVQRLENLDRYGSTKLQPAYAGAVQLKFKWDHLRAQAIGLIRNLEYILQNVPSLTPFVALPETGTKASPEYFVAATVDWYFEKQHVMPFLTGGIQFPATFETTNPRTVQVIRDATRRDRLPTGFGAVPIYQLRVGLQWDLSEFFALLGNFQYVRDENLTRLVIDPTGERQSQREFQDPNAFGFTILARARF